MVIFFGKYKYISNKGELKGNHRGSRSPFQIQGLGRTPKLLGGWTLVQSQLVENSQDRFTAREKFEYVDYVFHELSRKSKRMWRAASKNIFWSSGDDDVAHAKKPTAQVCASNWQWNNHILNNGGQNWPIQFCPSLFIRYSLSRDRHRMTGRNKQPKQKRSRHEKNKMTKKCAEISRNAEILCWGTRKKIMLRRGLNLFEEYLESKIEMNLHKSGNKTALIS